MAACVSRGVDGGERAGGEVGEGGRAVALTEPMYAVS